MSLRASACLAYSETIDSRVTLLSMLKPTTTKLMGAHRELHHAHGDIVLFRVLSAVKLHFEAAGGSVVHYLFSSRASSRCKHVASRASSC